jgi:hypothetical protein
MAREDAHPASLTGFVSSRKGKIQTAVRARAQSPPRRRVSWIPGQIPRNEEEEILRHAILQKGLETFDEVKAYLADTLYWRDFLRGGWATDIALLRPLYACEAQAIIGTLRGVRLLVEEAE